MKKYLLFTLLIINSLSLFAQRFGYIETEVIISKMPEYKEALQTIDKLTEQWASEVKRKQKSLDSLKIAYKAEELLLTAEMKVERLKKIEEKEKDFRDYQSNTFGYEGLMYLKRQELIKPLQEKIAKATEQVARKKKLQFLFDKSADLMMIYADPRHNYTDYVLEELGLGDPSDTPK